MLATTCENLTRKLCGHITKPFPDCYCFSISSTCISKVLEFCGGDNSSCPIYQQNTNLHNNEKRRFASLTCS